MRNVAIACLALVVGLLGALFAARQAEGRAKRTSAPSQVVMLSCAREKLIEGGRIFTLASSSSREAPEVDVGHSEQCAQSLAELLDEAFVVEHVQAVEGQGIVYTLVKR